MHYFHVAARCVVDIQLNLNLPEYFRAEKLIPHKFLQNARRYHLRKLETAGRDTSMSKSEYLSHQEPLLGVPSSDARTTKIIAARLR
jgi:hypothetical protein